MAVANNKPSTKKLGGATGKGFMPGKSGNPSGRPKGVAAKARELIDDDPSSLLKVFLAVARNAKAKPGDRIIAAREYLDRAYGKAPAFAPVEGADPLERDAVEREIAGLVDELASRRAAATAGEASAGAMAADVAAGAEAATG